MQSTCPYNVSCSYNTADGYADRIELSTTSNITISIIISLLLLVGILGNICVLITVVPDKKPKSTTSLFLISLSISDLISAMICSPLWLYRRTWGFDQWKWPTFLCQFYWFMDFGTDYVTSLHIVSFAILRYIAVKFPLRFKYISPENTKKYLIFLWVISFLMSSPLLFVMSTGTNANKWPDCSICNMNFFQSYTSAVSLVLFYIPELLIVIFSLMLVNQLFTRKRKRKTLYRTKAEARQTLSAPTMEGCLPTISESVFKNKYSTWPSLKGMSNFTHAISRRSQSLTSSLDDFDQQMKIRTFTPRVSIENKAPGSPTNAENKCLGRRERFINSAEQYHSFANIHVFRQAKKQCFRRSSLHLPSVRMHSTITDYATNFLQKSEERHSSERKLPKTDISKTVRENLNRRHNSEPFFSSSTTEETASPQDTISVKRVNCWHEYIKNISRQMIMISVCYLIGYIPTTVYSIWTSYSAVNCTEKYTEYYYTLDYWFGVGAYICLRASECMNPLMYFWGSADMRNEAKRRLNSLAKYAFKSCEV